MEDHIGKREQKNLFEEIMTKIYSSLMKILKYRSKRFNKSQAEKNTN